MLSYIVVTYNSERFVEACLKSIYEKTDISDFEIILKDNNSTDSTVEIVRRFMRDKRNIKLLVSGENNGFAGGNNDAAAAASGELLFILSPDARVEKYSHSRVLGLLDSDKAISVIQPKIRKMLYPDIVESTGHHIDSLGNAYVENADAPDQSFDTRRIFSPTGASFVMKKDIFDRLGGFDNDYFILYEETDLCWRNNLLGYKSFYLDDIEVLHFGSGSMNQGVERGVRINYKMTYFYLRNKISTGIKNFQENDLLARFILGNILLYVFSSFYWLMRLDLEYFKIIWRALFFNLFRAQYIFKKRRLIKDIFKVGNRELMKEGLIVNFNFGKWLNKVKA